MGRGDKKTKKGKIFKGSFGVSRPKKTNTVVNKEIKTKKLKVRLKKEKKKKKSQ